MIVQTGILNDEFAQYTCWALKEYKKICPRYYNYLLKHFGTEYD